MAIAWPGGALAAGAGSPPPVDLLAEAVRVAGYLLVLLVTLVMAARLARRWQPGLGGSGPIQLLDGQNLAPGVGVRLVRVGSRTWLLGVTRERVSLLAEVTGESLDPVSQGKSG